MIQDKIYSVYFLGIGGIGMSALARYFLMKGMSVAGYDKTSSDLTKQLEEEGIPVHYDDNSELIPAGFKQNREGTLIVYTPAIPAGHREKQYFTDQGFTILKRSEVLGQITRDHECIAVAGTHGKTTVTTMIAHLLTRSHIGCNAFLGGISLNYHSNLILSTESNKVVVEADEFDRSFLTLSPNYAIITAIDEDHLDIYHTKEALVETFGQFVKQIEEVLILKKGVEIPCSGNIRVYSYALDSEADFFAKNILVNNGQYQYDLVCPDKTIKEIKLGTPGLMNVENSIAAASMGWLLGVTEEELRLGLGSFKGVKRRFEYIFRSKEVVYIDDYAHHPEELKACIKAVRHLYPDRKITGVFQPHLYSRTKDLGENFARSLELLDELILLDIYPAREMPLPGIDSGWLLNQVQLDHKMFCPKEMLVNKLEEKKLDILLTMGAGDIDRWAQPIKQMLSSRYKQL